MTKQLWTVEKLSDHYAELNGDHGPALRTVLDWAVKHERLVTSEAKAPLFGVAGSSGELLFSLFASGHLFVFLDERRYSGGSSERDELFDALVAMDLMRADLDLRKVAQGRSATRTIGALSDDEMARLLEFFGRYCVPGAR